MSQYGEYAIRFANGKYMSKGHWKTNDINKAFRYIMSEDALGCVRYFQDEDGMEVFNINTGKVVYSVEECNTHRRYMKKAPTLQEIAMKMAIKRVYFATTNDVEFGQKVTVFITEDSLVRCSTYQSYPEVSFDTIKACPMTEEDLSIQDCLIDKGFKILDDGVFVGFTVSQEKQAAQILHSEEQYTLLKVIM